MSSRAAADRAAERGELVRQIRARSAAEFTVPTIPDRVLEVLSRVPRHEFVPPESACLAYADTPLPIGHGQTISQPTVVAVMTALADPSPQDVVLEIGTGCGYQAAVLSELARHVYSVELVPELARDAAARLVRLGYEGVSVRCADGYAGWEEHAPFASVVVTAAAEDVPPPLVEQLDRGGRLVIPLETTLLGQELTLIEKDREGALARRSILPVAFVPLRRPV